MARSRVRCPFVLLLALVSLAALADVPASAVAMSNPLDSTTTVPEGPVLTGVACNGGTPGTLTVTGERFTPGGEVDVVVYALGTTKPDAIHSVRATLPLFGRNGSTDPANGFKPGGGVNAALGHYCGVTAVVRAYDQEAGSWSDGLVVDLSCESAK
jgi:hypothetical protein